MTTDDILTVAQAAELLGVTPGRVRHLIGEGRLPGARILSREYMIPRASVTGFVRLPHGRPPNSSQTETKRNSGK